MIKANELRIGNWVLVSVKTDNDEKLEIRIDINDLRRIYEGSELYNFEPILLTEEWLLKFGFKLKQNSLFTKKLEYIYNSIKYCDDNKIWIYYNDDNDAGCNAIADLNYVHELQNLYFALTKQELPFK